MKDKTGFANGRRVAALLGVVMALLFPGCLSVRVSPARPLPDNAIPQVVAVSSFDNRSGFPGQWELGGGMADLLVSELVASKNFVVVERAHLDKVVGELERQKDALFRSEGKVDRGRLKNAHYLIRGVINDFSQVGGGSIGVAIRSLFFGGRGYKARVALTLTLVNVESGEIIDSVQCAGDSRAREAYAKGAYSGVSFGGDAFFKTPLGMATADAIRRGVRGIVEKVPRVFWEARIASVSEDGRIILNGGEKRGFRVGQTYDVRGEGKAVTDPVTGDLLSVIPGPIVGTLRVATVEESIAYASPASGKGFERGQRLIRVGP